MTREEFRAIQKTHMKLEAKIKGLRRQQSNLEDGLKGQHVDWHHHGRGLVRGVVISHAGGKGVQVETNGVLYILQLQRLYFDENVEVTEK